MNILVKCIGFITKAWKSVEPDTTESSIQKW